MNLSEKHLEMLEVESAINAEVISNRGYRTVTDKKELAALGFAKSQQLTPGLLLPVYAPDGSNGLYQFRPNAPRSDKKGKLVKYETPVGAAMRLDCPTICRASIKDPSIPLWITEGIKKGDSLASHGFCAVALLGVWNFKGENEFGGVTLLADFDYIALKGRKVRICFDSDIMQKPEVRLAMERLTEHLERKGARVSAVYLPETETGKTGVDDFLASHSPAELEKLVTLPKPALMPAPPVFEFLEAAPETMRRPLSIIGGHAFAATWLHVKKIVSESLDDNGNIVKHNPPKETFSREFFVLRDDGTLFGKGQNDSLESLVFEIHLPEIPPEKLLLQARAVEFYRAGKRKDIVEVFRAVRAVFDGFLDFSRSLADQETMSELAACYVLATWFTEAFNVAGYVWATGERGSGKTQLLLLISELGFLGQFIQASGSLASLRDLADYGAFLGFDDAEQVSNKTFDPDKRNLLLAGNRRGSQIPLKESVPNSREWRTRYVNTFCPRGFSATRSPDSILGSRAITIPLVRTANKQKGDADPSDETCWTKKPVELRQDLWLIALAHLAEMQTVDRDAASRATLTGRNLEAWRGVLAVAALLDREDERHELKRETGDLQISLFERMNRLSIDYQQERSELESADITRLVLRSIAALIVGISDDPVEESGLQRLEKQAWKLQTKDISERARRLVEEEELDFDLETINSRRIGRCIGKLRLENDRRGGKGTHGWKIALSDLEQLLSSFGLLKRDVSFSNSDTQIQNVTNVTNVTPGDGENLQFTKNKLFDLPSGDEIDSSSNNEPERCWQPNCRAFLHGADVCPNCGTNQNDIPF